MQRTHVFVAKLLLKSITISFEIPEMFQSDFTLSGPSKHKEMYVCLYHRKTNANLLKLQCKGGVLHLPCNKPFTDGRKKRNLFIGVFPGIRTNHFAFLSAERDIVKLLQLFWKVKSVWIQRFFRLQYIPISLHVFRSLSSCIPRNCEWR